jgi:uncharacterized membrane protein YhaH (DUF805 family)
MTSLRSGVKLKGMNFIDSTKKCLIKDYANFNGRSSRSEYWFFFLFLIVLWFIYIWSLMILDLNGILNLSDNLTWFSYLFFIPLTLPLYGVAVRRLHDINKSGWWVLVGVIPFVNIIGGLLLLYWVCKKGDQKDNRFGKNIY